MKQITLEELTELQRKIARNVKHQGWCIAHNEPHHPTIECCAHILDSCHCRRRTATITKNGIRECMDCGKQPCIENHPKPIYMVDRAQKTR